MPRGICAAIAAFAVLTITVAAPIPLVGQHAIARDALTDVAAIDYARDWIVPPKVAYELIQQGALVIDARDSFLRWRQGKLPNAVTVTWDELSQPDAPTKGQLLTDTDEYNRRLRALGISKTRPIVVVADPLNGWGEDGRIAWTLRSLGHHQVVIVDGGLPALRKQGTLKVKPAQVPGDFSVTRENQWEVLKEELRARLAKGDLAIIDAREPREYAGATPYGETRGGHIPGAQTLWFRSLIGQDGKLLPHDEIERVLASKGITKDKEIVAYCTGGIRSGWLTAVLNDLGYKARNYAGSMWEWSAGAPDEYPLVKN